jgi:hypothetical protein
MPLRPTRSVDERRRRLLTGKVVESPAAPEEGEGGRRRTSRKQNPRYTQAARMENQPRVTDLVPQRPWVIAVWLTLGLLIIGGLECLYFYMPQIGAMTTDGRVAAFDLDGEGSLAGWFSSAVLALCGLTAVLIYTLRKHRIDDYRGRYRVWLWAAALWLVMSIDESGSLHEGFKEMMTALTGKRLLGDGSMWWVIAYGSLLAVVGVRMLLDLRESWPATMAVAATAACYAAAVATQLGWLLPERGALAVMLEEGCEMAGGVFLLLAMALYARFLIRDIQGLYALRHSQKAERVAHKEAARAAKAAAADERRKAAAAAAKAREEESAARLKAKQDAAAEKQAQKQAAKKAAAERPSPPPAEKKPSAKPNPPMASPPAKGTANAASTHGGEKTSRSPFAGSLLSGGKGDASKPANLRIDAAEQDAAGAHLSKAQRKALKRKQEMEARMKKS